MRRLTAYILYYLGDVISRLPRFPYPLYNWLMLKSQDMQGKGNGPWNLAVNQESD